MKKSDWDYLEKEPGLIYPTRNFGLIEDLACPMKRRTADPDDEQSIWLETLLSYSERDTYRKKKSRRR